MAMWSCVRSASVMMATVVISSTIYAAPPTKTLTKASGDQGVIVLYTSTFNLYFRAELVKSTETGDAVVSQIGYNYYNYENGDNGEGSCTVAPGTITGRVSTERGQLSLRTINTGSLFIRRIANANRAATSKSLSIGCRMVMQKLHKMVTLRYKKFPDGSRFASVDKGKFVSLTADANVNIIGGIGAFRDIVRGGGSYIHIIMLVKRLRSLRVRHRKGEFLIIIFIRSNDHTSA